MRLFGRRADSILIIGLTIALAVIFARPIGRLLDIAREVEQASGLALIPALIILMVVFLLHQQGKRQQVKAEAIASAAAAQSAGALAATWSGSSRSSRRWPARSTPNRFARRCCSTCRRWRARLTMWALVRSDGHWHR